MSSVRIINWVPSVSEQKRRASSSPPQIPKRGAPVLIFIQSAVGKYHLAVRICTFSVRLVIERDDRNRIQEAPRRTSGVEFR
jgi:hypothetical protein